MRIALDFADPAQAARVPRHGWAKNSQGVKLLWLPVLRLVHEAHEIRKAQTAYPSCLVASGLKSGRLTKRSATSA